MPQTWSKGDNCWARFIYKVIQRLKSSSFDNFSYFNYIDDI